MRKLAAVFDDIPRAETALEELDDAGLPLGTFRLLTLRAKRRAAPQHRVSVRRAVAGLLIRALASLLGGRRRTDDMFSVVVEVLVDEDSLERATLILREAGGRIVESAD